MIFYEVIFHFDWNVQHHYFMLTWNSIFNHGLFENVFRFDWDILWKKYSILTGTHMDWDSQIVYILYPMIENCMLIETERTQKIYVDWDLENIYFDCVLCLILYWLGLRVPSLVYVDLDSHPWLCCSMKIYSLLTGTHKLENYILWNHIPCWLRLTISLFHVNLFI